MKIIPKHSFIAVSLALSMKMVVMPVQSFAQQKEKTYEQYMQSSIKKKNLAKTLLIGGLSATALGTTGTIYSFDRLAQDDGNAGYIGLGIFSVGLMAGGFASSLGSIPLFIFSKKDKENAMQIRPSVSQTTYLSQPIPTIGFKVIF